MASGDIFTPEHRRLLRQAATTCTDCYPLLDAARLLNIPVDAAVAELDHLKRMVEDVLEFERLHREAAREPK